MKYTPEQYAESARKHGIPCGPYNGKQTHPGTSEIRYVKAVGGVELCVSYAAAIGSQKLCDGFVRACESLPDLLIALDERDAEIERLRKVLATIVENIRESYDEENDPAWWQGTLCIHVAGETAQKAVAALNGGAA